MTTLRHHGRLGPLPRHAALAESPDPALFRRPHAEQSPHMRLFEAKYDESQRDAVIRAMVDEGWTAPAVVQAAAMGKLPSCPEPFVIPRSTVYWLARQERQTRQLEAFEARIAAEPLSDIFAELTRSMLKTLLIEARRCQAEADRGDLDIRRAQALIRCQQSVAKLVPDDSLSDDVDDLSELAAELETAVYDSRRTATPR